MEMAQAARAHATVETGRKTRIRRYGQGLS